MGLVLFSWFTTTLEFENYKQNVNIRKSLYGDKAKEFEEEMTGIYVDDGVNDTEETIIDSDGLVWTTATMTES